ncbi:hypothetical protein ED28_09525 [[Pantoea] beijingensis]|uniref:Uncharacterized protein n=1 Tax=[Pantoea] beijingensis TaxID=1324864 RepID=A0A443IC76_9GAMM|nr:hypothetical protein ED28_09525 [[Pantoea] beijingensis]
MRAIILAGSLALVACSSDYRGKECTGKIENLQGQPLGETRAKIIDRFTSFTITSDGGNVDSGPLHSKDRRLYFPSAVTQEGFYAQRLSDQQFGLINAPKNQVIIYTCH